MNNIIDYKYRAKFYDYETNLSYDMEYFLKYCITKLNNKVVMDVPCSVGKKAPILSKYAKKVFLVDCEDEMLKITNNKLLNYKLNNTILIKNRLQDIEIHDELDCIFILNQAIQFLDECEIKSLLSKIKGNNITLYIEINDFKVKNSSNSLAYFNYLENENSFIFDKSFNYKSVTMKRYRKYQFKNNGIEITFEYKYKNNSYITTLFLYNYSFHKFIEICSASGVFIKNIFSDYKLNPYIIGDANMIFELIGV